MRTLRFLQFFFRRVFMSFPKKRRRAKVDGDESFLAVLRHFKPFGQLDTKIARARAQDFWRIGSLRAAVADRSE